MDKNERDPILDRLEEIEGKLNSALLRISQLEETKTQEAQVIAPPIIAPAPAEAPWSSHQSRESAETLPTTVQATIGSKEPVEDKRPDDFEYRLGMTGLLRGGAVVLVIGLLYLVALAISRGYITPTTQFVGELVLCAIFISIGFIKRNEKEEFGQIMTGIGSCGLYFSLAGGNIYKSLYSGEVLVALFTILSLANLAYSNWRSSKPFLTLGSVGGFVGAAMAMQESKIVLDFSLHALILAAAFFVVARNRWWNMAILVWVASTLALFPALDTSLFHELQIAAIYVNSIVCAVLAGVCIIDDKPERFANWIIAIIGIGGIFAIGIDQGLRGSLHSLILAATSILVSGLFFKKIGVRNALIFAGICVAAVLGPIGFEPLTAAITYACISCLLSFIAIRFSARFLAGLSWITFFLALVSYNLMLDIPDRLSVGPTNESVVLALLMIAAVSCTVAMRRAEQSSENWALVALLICLPLFARFGFVNLTANYIGWTDSLAMMVSLLIYSSVVLTVATTGKWKSIAIFGWFPIALALYAFVMLIDSGQNLPMPNTLLALLTAAVVSFAGFANTRWQSKDQFELTIGVCGLIVGLMIVRIAVVWLTPPQNVVTLASAISFGSFVTFALSLLVARITSWNSLIPNSWLALATGIITTLQYDVAIAHQLSLRTWHVGISIICILWCAFETSKITKERTILQSVSILAIWILLSVLCLDLLTKSPINLKDNAAVTAAWTLYAVTLLALGFRYLARNLRLWSFVVFFATVAKVFLIDLSDLDPGVRVLILIGLGIGMIAGGYWYIRQQHNPSNSETSEQENYRDENSASHFEHR